MLLMGTLNPAHFTSHGDVGWSNEFVTVVVCCRQLTVWEVIATLPGQCMTHAGSGVVGINLLRFQARCRTR